MGIVTKMLNSELSTSSNIKNRSVNKAVATALKACLQSIKTSKWHAAPENGLVLCAGRTLSCV